MKSLQIPIIAPEKIPETIDVINVIDFIQSELDSCNNIMMLVAAYKT